MIRRTFASLGNPQFRLLWLGQLLLMGGVNMQMLARAFLAWELTNSVTAVAIAGMGFAPPMLLFSLFGGTLADRLDRKKIMMLGQFGSILIVIFIGISITTDTVSIGHLIAAAFFQGTFFAFMSPARTAMIPQLVDKDQISNAIALNSGNMAIMTLAGPAIGGIIYATGGPEAAYFTVAGMCALALIFTSLIRNPKPPKPKNTTRVWRDILEGLQYAQRNKTVLMLLLLVLGTTLLSYPVRSLMPAQIEVVFLRDVKSLGLLMGMIGLGAVIGSVIIAGLTPNHRRGLIMLSMAGVSGIAIIAVGLNTHYWIAALIMVVIGLGDAGRRALNTSLLVEQSDDAHRGRVMGLYMMNFGLMPVGSVPIAMLADAFTDAKLGIQISFSLAGFLLVLVAIIATIGTSRIRRL